MEMIERVNPGCQCRRIAAALCNAGLLTIEEYLEVLLGPAGCAGLTEDSEVDLTALLVLADGDAAALSG